MASTIQLKTGTGSAVPSSLTQGEVAINVDNGLIYYGSGSVNSVKQLETFTNITASGNISASGGISATGDIQADRIAIGDGDSLFAGQLTVEQDIVANRNITGDNQTAILGIKQIISNDFVSSSQLISNGNITASLNISASGNIIGDKIFGNLIGGKVDGSGIVLGSASDIHVTASGNISASGDIILGQNIYFNGDETRLRSLSSYLGFFASGGGAKEIKARSLTLSNDFNDSAPTNGLFVKGDATIQGTLTAQEFHTEFVSASIIFESGSTQFGNSADDIHTFSGSINVKDNGHITASGNISASGDGIFDRVGVGGPPSYKFHVNSGTTNTVALFQSTDDKAFIILKDDTTDSYLISKDNKFYIGADSSDTSRFNIDVTNGKVGIGTSTPDQKLNVHGNIHVSGSGLGHITASGNIQGASMTIGTDTVYSNFLNINNSGGIRIGNAEYIAKSGNDLSLFQGKLTLYNVGGGAKFTGPVTASADISSSGGLQVGFGTFSGTTDTVTDAAILIPENKAIYTIDGGQHIRNLIRKDTDVIKIGQSGTALVDEIRFLPGNLGFTSFYGDSTEVARVDNSGNITASGNISASGNLTVNSEIRGNTGLNLYPTEGSNNGRIQLGQSDTIFFSPPRPNTDISTKLGTATKRWSELNVQHITASGGISASGTGQFGDDITITSGSLNIETFSEGIRFFNGTNYTANKIQLSTAQNLQISVGGVIQLYDQTQLLAASPLKFNNADNTDSILVHNGAGSGAGKSRLDFEDSSNNVKMSISSSGNVGIGTTSPPEKLTVEGNISASGNVITEGNITASGNISASGDLFVRNIRINDPDGGTTFEIDTSTGDGKIRFTDNGNIKWDLGRDNTQQNFVISNGSGLGTDDLFILTTGNNIQLNGAVTASGNISASNFIGAPIQIVTHAWYSATNTDDWGLGKLTNGDDNFGWADRGWDDGVDKSDVDAGDGDTGTFTHLDFNKGVRINHNITDIELVGTLRPNASVTELNYYIYKGTPFNGGAGSTMTFLASASSATTTNGRPNDIYITGSTGLQADKGDYIYVFANSDIAGSKVMKGSYTVTAKTR